VLVDGRFLNTRKVLRRCGQPAVTFFPVVPDPVPRQRCKTVHVLVFVTQRLGRLRMTQFQEIQQVQTSELHVSLFDIWQRVV